MLVIIFECLAARFCQSKDWTQYVNPLTEHNHLLDYQQVTPALPLPALGE